MLEEMDLDAMLARRPALVLVDEFAHTNAPGSRHPKRYLDVEELLAAGIDVFTTLNVQHVESLNDVVAQITRVRVQETVPDGIVDSADDIEVVDLTPGDLIQRLRDGKVYVPETARRALDSYFSAGQPHRLARARLAPNRPARRRAIARPHAGQCHSRARGPPASACLSHRRRPRRPPLVRYGRRMSERLRAAWTVLHVETPRSLKLSEADRDRIAQTLRGAERLGADTIVLPGRRAADEILAFAIANNATHLVIAKPRRSTMANLAGRRRRRADGALWPDQHPCSGRRR